MTGTSASSKIEGKRSIFRTLAWTVELGDHVCQPLASALLAAKGRASADLPICRLQQQRLAADLPSPWDGACGNAHACCRWRMITQHAAACCTATDSMKLLACSRGEKCLLTFFVKVSNAIQSRCIQCAGCCTYVIDGAGAAHGRVSGRQHANGIVWDPVTSSAQPASSAGRHVHAHVRQGTAGQLTAAGLVGSLLGGGRSAAGMSCSFLRPATPQFAHRFRPSAAGLQHFVTH